MVASDFNLPGLGLFSWVVIFVGVILDALRRCVCVAVWPFCSGLWLGLRWLVSFGCMFRVCFFNILVEIN